MPAKNLTLGRGKLYFAPYKAGTETPTGRRYLGNTPEFNISISTENLDHFDADEGVREVDDSVAIQTERSATITTDDVQPANLALAFLGSNTLLSQASGSAIATSYDGVSPGLVYQLGASASNPTGDRSVSSVVVKDDTTPTAITYVVNTDYTVDAVRGTITVVPGGSITEGKNLRITHSRAAVSRDLILSGNQSIYGELYYEAKNPKGQQIDYLMPKVRLSPSGDFVVKGESDWQSISFDVGVLKKSGLAAIYGAGLPIV